MGHAQRRHAHGGFLLAQGRWQIAVGIVDPALDDLGHTGPAGTAAATVGQHNPLAQGGIEDGFVGFDREPVTAGLDFDGETHENARKWMKGAALSPK